MPGIRFSRPGIKNNTMESTPFNVFILGDYALVANGLRHRLQQKFGSAVHVSVFCDVHHCLKKVDNSTHLVVVDEHVEGKPASFIGAQCRAINPEVEVVVHENAERVIRAVSMHLRQRLMPEAAAVFSFV